MESSRVFVGQLSDNLSPVPLVRAKIRGHQRCKNLVLAHQGSQSFLRGFKGLWRHMVPHRGALSIAELSRDGWGANTIGGQLPKELADKRATANSRD